MSKKLRGFELVDNAFRKNIASKPSETFYDRFEKEPGVFTYLPTLSLPTRADKGSAGYDFYAPINILVLPGRHTLLFTDVKAFMQDDEVLKLYIRSSLALKHGIILSNNVGIIDSSYYSNQENDGNIGCSLYNTTGTAVSIKAGERIMQGIFTKFLIADVDAVTAKERTGGIGSSGK